MDNPPTRTPAQPERGSGEGGAGAVEAPEPPGASTLSPECFPASGTCRFEGPPPLRGGRYAALASRWRGGRPP